VRGQLKVASRIQLDFIQVTGFDGAVSDTTMQDFQVLLLYDLDAK